MRAPFYRQTARLPERRLITSTANAITNSRWINPPATFVAKPSTQSASRTTKIVHSISYLTFSKLLLRTEPAMPAPS